MRTKTLHQSDKMLDAATQLFGTHRFHEVRMEDIAAEAGVGKGTLYRYFSDKEELYLALLRRASKQFVARMNDVVREAVGPRAQLEALVAAILDYFDEQPHLLDLIQRAEVSRGMGPDFPWYETRDELVRLVLALFEEARLRRIWTARDPHVSALMLLGGLRSVLRYGKRPRPADLAECVVTGFLQGMARPDCP